MMNLDELGSKVQQVRDEVAKVIVGQKEAIDMLLVSLLTGGHVLLEGVPGTAKTLMIRTFAYVLGGSFKRIQFTPDLMPADITGTKIYNARDMTFDFNKGPIFCDFLLADEINRTPAKTQSALLEAMQERTVTIDADSYLISKVFTVFATQNPIEYEGTYSLPEAQSDRFLLKVNIDYPSEQEEDAIIMAHHRGMDVIQLDKSGIKQIFDIETLYEARGQIQQVEVEEKLVKYIRKIVRATREDSSVLLGGGPRASISLLTASKAYANLQGRNFIIPDDIKALALPVLRHRLIFRPEAEMDGIKPEDLLEALFKKIEVPR
ncbi:AAA family ATPase [Planctomycetota bacterium]